MAAQQLIIRNRIQWDRSSSILLTAGSDILVEVEGKPEAGYGFLLAEHPSDQKRSIRWYVDRVEGRINANSLNQIVVSGSYLQLFPDYKNPRLNDWIIYLSPVLAEGENYASN